jgi:hypothetical protein
MSLGRQKEAQSVLRQEHATEQEALKTPFHYLVPILP